MPQSRLSITLVVDNEVADGLVAEHGFAAWIEAGEHRILFDTGQGSAFIPNCASLGIDLPRANALVLSHGHYDHTGGLPDFLARNHDAPLYFATGFEVIRYSCHPEKPPRDISIGEKVRNVLNELPEQRRIALDSPRYLYPGIGISGPIPRVTPFEDTGGPFFLDPDQQQPDLINDDMSMWFETTEGLLILTGCCHSGLVNTVQYIRQFTGIERVHGIIGGLHLLQASEERLQKTLRFLDDCAPELMVPCHCTGDESIKRIVQAFGTKRVQPGGAGRYFRPMPSTVEQNVAEPTRS
ncbi:MAG: ribonuclease Z [Betaproteobacteria bacterium ADurb.Bin341]|nr:MAG: ribonuclease Z [Betaproteobacteria bacterium ADurb.Bin341]